MVFWFTFFEIGEKRFAFLLWENLLFDWENLKTDMNHTVQSGE